MTKDMIARGIDEEVIRFVTDPNMGHGTVCQIGDGWFYFGGSMAEELSPEEYLGAVAKCELVQEVYETLDAFNKDAEELADEYRYYEAYLNERVGDRKLWMRLGVVLNMTAEEARIVLGSDSNTDVVCDTIRRIVREGRYQPDGDSYIPLQSVWDYNDRYGTHYEEDEIGLDI